MQEFRSVQVLRYIILLQSFLFFSLLATAQRNIEIGMGVIGSGVAVDPIPFAFRSDFEGPITYLGYYVEGAALLSNHKIWKPRAVVRLQSEGSNASKDWPAIRVLSTSLGCMTGYQLTPVISLIGGGFANYQLASQYEVIHTDQPQAEVAQLWSARITGGVRGDFGRWSSEMLIEKSLTGQNGGVTLAREGSPSFMPTYSFLNVHLGVKYILFQASEKT